MEFLVHIETTLPATWSERQRSDLLGREAHRGAELLRAGMIRFIWRLPGRLANVGIWSATSTEELHDALTSLPAWTYQHISVTPLARHPLSE